MRLGRFVASCMHGRILLLALLVLLLVVVLVLLLVEMERMG